MRQVPAHGNIEIGHVALGLALRRTRAATEGFWLMMREAFAAGNRRLEWKCDALNAPSRAAALRLGFRFEGIFRRHLIVKGRSRDTAWFAINDDEWPAIDEALCVLARRCQLRRCWRAAPTLVELDAAPRLIDVPPQPPLRCPHTESGCGAVW